MPGINNWLVDYSQKSPGKSQKKNFFKNRVATEEFSDILYCGLFALKKYLGGKI